MKVKKLNTNSSCVGRFPPHQFKYGTWNIQRTILHSGCRHLFMGANYIAHFLFRTGGRTDNQWIINYSFATFGPIDGKYIRGGVYVLSTTSLRDIELIFLPQHINQKQTLMRVWIRSKLIIQHIHSLVLP